MQIPILNIWFRKYNEQGNPVRGHAARCYAIASEWRQRGGEVKYFERRATYCNIVLEDGYYSGLWAPFIINILDKPEHIYSTDMIICHSPGAEFEDWKQNTIKLLGPKYFLRRPEYDEVEVEDIGYIAVLPGGNKKEFFSQVNLDKLEKRYHIIDGYSPKVTAWIIACSSAVICPASVTAMEAMSLGKPTWIVKTAEDQELLSRWLPRLGAYYYPFHDEVDFALNKNSNLLRYQTYKSKLCISQDGTKRVVDRILEEWRKKNG